MASRAAGAAAARYSCEADIQFTAIEIAGVTWTAGTVTRIRWPSGLGHAELALPGRRNSSCGSPIASVAPEVTGTLTSEKSGLRRMTSRSPATQKPTTAPVRETCWREPGLGKLWTYAWELPDSSEK